jgi:type IV pilus assembly protein PilW
MSRDIRMAGYTGCSDRSTKFVNDLAESFWNRFTVPGSDLSAFISVEGLNSAGNVGELGLNPAAVADSDILALRFAAGSPHILESTNSDTPGVIRIRAAGVVPALNCANGICNGASLMVTNCAGGRVFAAANVNWAADVTTITHAGGWPTTPSPYENFFANNELLPVWTVVYYIGLNPAGRPSLYRREAGAPAVEIFEGIENVSFRYHVPGQGYLSAPEIQAGGFNQWALVDGVRAELLLQGAEDNVLEAPQGYTFAGQDVPGPADRRVRQVFTSTVAIRARVSDF